jgi:Flp pilus assembly protein protease CpaA
MGKFWHWVAIVVVVFICIAIYNAGTLGSLPGVGKYLSS